MGQNQFSFFFQLWMAHTMAVKRVLETVIVKHPKAVDAMPCTLDAYTINMKCYFEAGFKYYSTLCKCTIAKTSNLVK